MAKKILQSAKLAASAGIMSHGVEVPVGKMVFVSGQVARDLDGNVVGVGDIYAQTRQVLRNMQAVLAESEATMDDVVKVTVFVTNLEDHLVASHEVRSEFFKNGYLARSLVELSSLVHKDFLIEIEAIAVTH